MILLCSRLNSETSTRYRASPIHKQKRRLSKTLGFEWNTQSDQFNLTIADLPSLASVTKRALASDIAKTFCPYHNPSKDDLVPDDVKQAWIQRAASQLIVTTILRTPRLNRFRFMGFAMRQKLPTQELYIFV